MKLVFQPVTKNDVYLLKDIALKTFVESYQHLNSKDNFENYITNAFAIDQLLYELGNNESFFYFVLFRDNIIGYLKLNIGVSQTVKHCLNCLEIERIYLKTDYQRMGIGRKMIQFGIDKAKHFSKSKIWLGVWEKNPDAIKFYKNQGFVEMGSHVFKFGDEDQIDIIFEQSLCKE